MVRSLSTVMRTYTQHDRHEGQLHGIILRLRLPNNGITDAYDRDFSLREPPKRDGCRYVGQYMSVMLLLLCNDRRRLHTPDGVSA